MTTFDQIRQLVNEKDDLEHRLLVLDQATDWSGSWPRDQAIQIKQRIAEINALLNSA